MVVEFWEGVVVVSCSVEEAAVMSCLVETLVEFVVVTLVKMVVEVAVMSCLVEPLVTEAVV